MISASEASPPDFSAFSTQAARRFLRTAVLIDDEIDVFQTAAPEPQIAIVPPPFAEQEDASPVKTTAEASKPSDVALKPLADAFLDRQIICGVLKPARSDKTEAIIHRAVESSVAADIFIIDWYLRSGDARIAKQILASVLEQDRRLNGRLRLVIVYTSASPLGERRNELKTFLEEKNFSVEIFEGAAPGLIVESCRICFVEKPSGFTGMAVDKLPDFAISEFTDQAKGLMPAFALTGIAALREATHHLLATFSARLDPAFVGHRMLLQQPEDSQEFALNVLMLQIRSVLSLPHLLGSALKEAEIGAWFDQQYAADAIEPQLARLKVTKEDLRNVIIKGDSKKKSHYTALFVPAGLDKAQKQEEEISSDFARLTTFVREFEGFNPLPKDWRPILTQGTVLRTIVDKKKRYFLTVQPLCDTVRIGESRFFIFVELKPRDSKRSDFWLVIQESGERLHLRIDATAGSRHYDQFQPFESMGVVRATMNKSGAFIFKGRSKRNYEWIGDIERTKAQKAANDLSAVLARVGLDEYEWLRLGGKVG